jgi:predicted transcriptional regulator
VDTPVRRIRLSDEVYDYLRISAIKSKMTTSEMMEKIIEFYEKQQEENNNE